jgi:FkbM family methyltransferase
MTFIDAGSNMGLYSLFAASITGPNGQVLALEPSSREFDRLVTNCRLNPKLTVKPLNVALSDRHGTAELLVADDNHAGHNTLGSFAYSETKLKQRETVQIDSLDRITGSQAIERVDVMKVDIEGSELFALRGSSSVLERFKPVLLFELFDMALAKQGCDSKMVAQFIQGFGYDLFEFGESGRLVPLSLNPDLSRNVVGLHRSAIDALRDRVQFS